jgi:nucleoid-associated protein YgaU
MYEVTCFYCGHLARITPDAERCAACGADLKHLITPDYAARYFYDRAAELAAAGELTLARLEVERGLAYQPNSELYLLAAILSQRLGDYPQVRRYVAAIPVDDVLRPEAEWLLRAQQAPPPRAPQYTSRGAPPAGREVQPPTWSAAERREASRTERPTTTRINPMLYGAVAVVLVLVVAWFTIEPVAQAIFSLFSSGEADLAQTTPTPPAPPAEVIPTPGAEGEDTPAGEILPTPTPVIAPDLVQSAPTQEPVAAVTPLDQSATPFDLSGFLAQTNRPELAELEVSALLEGQTLKLQGIVQLFDQRASLIELAGRAPGVETVDAVDLLVRLPETYTVQEGDSLWLISYKLYGEDRVAELYNANLDTLTSPESLRVGQTLKVPPVE